jgi:hypothetical protein
MIDDEVQWNGGSSIKLGFFGESRDSGWGRRILFGTG